jgi:hypothetical protein
MRSCSHLVVLLLHAAAGAPCCGVHSIYSGAPCQLRCGGGGAARPPLPVLRAPPSEVLHPDARAARQSRHLPGGARPTAPTQSASDVEYNWLNLLTPNFMGFLVLFILAAQMTDSLFGVPIDKFRNALTPIAEAHAAVFDSAKSRASWQGGTKASPMTGKSSDPTTGARSVPGDLAWVPWDTH